MAALRPAIKLILAEALGLGVALTTFVPAGTTQQNIPMPGQPTAQVPTGAQNIPMPGQPTAQVPTGAQNIPMPGQPTAQVPTGAATQQSVDELKVLVLNFQKEIVRVGDKLDKHIKESGGYRPAEGRPQPPKRVAHPHRYYPYYPCCVPCPWW